MKWIILLTVILFFIPSLVSAEDHYVTQDGGSGSMSVDDFNALTGPDYAGDTFYFSGKITSQIDVGISGAPGHYVILDGYEADDTTYMHLSEAPGRALIDKGYDSGDSIHINGNSYIQIVDFEITDSGSMQIGNTPTTHDIIVKRCFIYETSNGLQVYAAYNVTIGGSAGNGNVFKNIGKTTSDEDISITYGGHDIIISYNHLYADDPDWGIDGITPCCGDERNVLVEYNSIHGHNRVTNGEDGIDLKDATHDWIIRYNHIYDHQYEGGVKINGNYGFNLYNIFVYGNRFHDNNYGAIYANADGNYQNIYFFSNIVYDDPSDGVKVGGPGEFWIFNNIIAECADEEPRTWDAGVFVSNADSTILKNNIFYKNRPNNYDYRQIAIYDNADTDVTADYNRYYWPEKISTIRWGDAGSLSLAELQSGSGNGLPQEAHGSEGDPGLTDLENNIYTVAGSDSAVVNSGDTMGTGNIAIIRIHGIDYPVIWDAALHPSTDWTTTPPTVITASQSDYDQWERGAYVYTGDEPQDTCESLNGDPCSEEQTCEGGSFQASSDYGNLCCVGGVCQDPPQTQSCITDLGGDECCAASETCSGTLITGATDCPYSCCQGTCQDASYGYMYIEAESGTISSPMQTGNDAAASGDQYVFVPAGTGDSSSPADEAVYPIDIMSAGDYYLWLLMYGPTSDNDALYIGFNGNFDRVYPSAPGQYEWVRAETTHGSGDYSHSLLLGQNEIQISHGEELARADSIFLTDDQDLHPTQASFHEADDNPRDGCIDVQELTAFIDLWYYDSTAYPMWDVMEAVVLYYSPGVWCS